MTAVRAALLGWLMFAIALACIANTANATTPPRHAVGGGVVSYRLAPPWVCTMQNRLEIFVDEDNILWACECEALRSGHICRWQVIGGVDAVNTRRYLRTLKATGKPVWITFQRNGKQTHYLSTFVRMP